MGSMAWHPGQLCGQLCGQPLSLWGFSPALGSVSQLLYMHSIHSAEVQRGNRTDRSQHKAGGHVEQAQLAGRASQVLQPAAFQNA